MTSRMPLIDALKAIASQLIVLHHLAIYGPMSDVIRPFAPVSVGWIDDHGRLAVQVFLVIGGFLAATALAPGGRTRIDAPPARIGRRAWRLAGPYWVAIGVAVAAAALARGWSDHPTVPTAPSIGQLAANLTMLQDVLGFEALSAGAWYVAIDLQLYACLVVLLWMGRLSGRREAGIAAVAALGLASLFVFNRQPQGDVWAPYFFGSYAMGAFAAWLPAARRPMLGLIALAAIVALALWVDFRIRIAVAGVTALVLAVAATRFTPEGGVRGPRAPGSTVLDGLGRISYSVFLIHYPVIVLFDAAWDRLFPAAPAANAVGLLLAFCCSTAAGAVFYRWVEAPLTGSRAPARE